MWVKNFKQNFPQLRLATPRSELPISMMLSWKKGEAKKIKKTKTPKDIVHFLYQKRSWNFDFSACWCKNVIKHNASGKKGIMSCCSCLFWVIKHKIMVKWTWPKRMKERGILRAQNFNSLAAKVTKNWALVTKAAFTQQTEVSKLVLANSSWCVWTAQKQSANKSANCWRQIELAPILANFFLLVNSYLMCERLANMCW